ncbi:MAG: HepT-like ribonuclease domain-containing protein [Bacteroidota bacterium]
MDNRIRSWLEDIERCIDEIFTFLPEQKNFIEYQKDLKTKKAVERNIEIIGEAVNRIIKSGFVDFEITNAQRIIGTRNRIIHEYDNISDEIIWTIIMKELPKLRTEILKLKNK